MVEHPEARLDAIFHALGDPTRRGILRDLAEGERTVGELAAPYATSLAAVSKHIKALESAGLVRREVRGRTHICHLDAQPLSDARAWLQYYERFWNSRLDELERLLRAERESPPERKSPGSESDETRSTRSTRDERRHFNRL